MYKPAETPFDKVANNRYYQRDARRQYPRTIVLQNTTESTTPAPGTYDGYACIIYVRSWNA